MYVYSYLNKVGKLFHAFDEHDLTFYNTNDIADIVCTFINFGRCVHVYTYVCINMHLDIFICTYICICID
jgi:hypothetical protein